VFISSAYRAAAALLILAAACDARAQSQPCPPADQYTVAVWNLQAANLRDAELKSSASALIENVDKRTAAPVAKTSVPADVLGTDSSRLIVGTADFLAQRANAEIRFWIKDELLTRVCGEKDHRVALAAYFPTLCSLQATYGFGMAPPDQTVAEAFRLDARALPACLVYRNHDNNTVGYLFLDLARQLRRGTNPLLLFAGLADTRFVREGCVDGTQSACPFYLGGVAVQSYLAASAPDPARSPSRDAALAKATLARYVAKLTDDGKTRLLEKIRDWAASNCSAARDGSFDAIIDCWIERNRGPVQQLENTFKAVRDDWDRFRAGAARQRDRDERREAYLDFIATALDRLTEIVETAGGRFPGLELPDVDRKRLRELLRVVKLVNSEQYPQALTQIYRCISSKDECGWNVAADPAVEPLKRYLPIAFELADAKSSDDIANTLDRVASPAGAWRMKQNHSMWSINAFVGPAWGAEKLWKDGSDTGTFRGHNKSLFAPVGVDYSHPTGYRWFPTWGAFVSGLDFGSLMSVGDGRNDGPIQVDSKATAGFAQILSPGLYIHAGIGNSPFVLGAGMSYYPLSREARRADGTTVMLDARVIRVFLGVDLTLMPF